MRVLGPKLGSTCKGVAAWLPRKLTTGANAPLNKSCSTRYWIEKYPSRRSWSGRLLNNRWPIKPIRVVTAIILDLLLTVWSRVVQIQALYRLNCQRWSQVGGQAWGYARINLKQKKRRVWEGLLGPQKPMHGIWFLTDFELMTSIGLFPLKIKLRLYSSKGVITSLKLSGSVLSISIS